MSISWLEEQKLYVGNERHTSNNRVVARLAQQLTSLLTIQSRHCVIVILILSIFLRHIQGAIYLYIKRICFIYSHLRKTDKNNSLSMQLALTFAFPFRRQKTLPIMKPEGLNIYYSKLEIRQYCHAITSDIHASPLLSAW
ncbi:hypothetical protein GGGNBK_00240 [Sporosarcina sp. ANT_H38]